MKIILKIYHLKCFASEWYYRPLCFKRKWRSFYHRFVYIFFSFHWSIEKKSLFYNSWILEFYRQTFKNVLWLWWLSWDDEKIILQLTYDHLTIILWSSYNHFRTILQSSYDHSTISLWPSYNHLLIILQAQDNLMII